MSNFTLTKNSANKEYFEHWLRAGYSNFDGMSDDGTNYILYFNPDHTSPEQTAITNFYNTLDGTEDETDFHCQIFDYMTWNGLHVLSTPPTEVDYRVSLDQRLHPIITDVYKGEVREITYYESVTVDPTTGVQTGTTPVVKENMVYTRNADKIAQYREMTIHWFLKDGTIHPNTKIRHKYYTNEQAISEGVTRRENIIDFMQIPMLGMMMSTIPCTYAEAVDQGGLFFEQYVVEVETYKFSPRQGTLQTAITNDTDYAWLNNVIDGNGTTIRAYMLDQLNY